MRPGALLLLCLPALTAQTLFRTDVKLIDVSVSVRDSAGRLVTDLTQDDFDVTEDGAPQKIAFFARSQDVPLNLGLLADFSGSQDPFLKAHHKDLDAFLAGVLGPRDKTFLLCFGNHLRLAAEPTSSPEAILAGLAAFEKGNHGFRELASEEDREGGTAFFDAIYNSVAEFLTKSDRGRKALIAFSDGEDNSSAHNMMETLEMAQANDVVLYGVRYTDLKNGKWNAHNKYGTGVMARMAQDTGGADFDARKTEMATQFKLIGEQLRSAYEIAYASSNPDADGLFRKISVQVKRPGLTVRAKTGYYAR
ncbi:MAG TPA: VWA domain-containing protein [Bryobacteraceae bacterium]|nr:VWA domain-containing protein [Bryobacteraceae bacterium]